MESGGEGRECGEVGNMWEICGNYVGRSFGICFLPFFLFLVFVVCMTDWYIWLNPNIYIPPLYMSLLPNTPKTHLIQSPLHHNQGLVTTKS